MQQGGSRSVGSRPGPSSRITNPHVRALPRELLSRLIDDPHITPALAIARKVVNDVSCEMWSWPGAVHQDSTPGASPQRSCCIQSEARVRAWPLWISTDRFVTSPAHCSCRSRDRVSVAEMEWVIA